MPPASAQRARPRGVARTISSRPDVSSDAQPPTNDAAARPARMIPNSTNSSWRNPPGAGVVDVRKDGRQQLDELRRVLQLLHEAAGRAAQDQAEESDADAPGERLAPRLVLIARPSRPTEPQQRARHGWRGQRRRDADVPASEGLDPHHQQRDDHERHEGHRRPVVLAGERDVVVGPAPPGQVRERSQLGDRRPVAVHDEPGECHGTGDPGRRPASHERRRARTPAPRRPTRSAPTRRRSRRRRGR